MKETKLRIVFLVLLLAGCVRTAAIPPTATLISDELPLQPPTQSSTAEQDQSLDLPLLRQSRH